MHIEERDTNVGENTIGKSIHPWLAGYRSYNINHIRITQPRDKINRFCNGFPTY